jgi:hypothetical protein
MRTATTNALQLAPHSQEAALKLIGHRESAFDEIFYQPLLDFSHFDSVSVIHDWNDDVRRRLINVKLCEILSYK